MCRTGHDEPMIASHLDPELSISPEMAEKHAKLPDGLDYCNDIQAKSSPFSCTPHYLAGSSDCGLVKLLVIDCGQKYQSFSYSTFKSFW